MPAQQKESTASLVKNWNATWNNHDSIAIVSLMDNDVQFISGRFALNGKDAVAKNFVSLNHKFLANLNTETNASYTDGNLAYETGKYTHNIKRGNSIIRKDEGTYTFVWNKSKNKEWKLKVIEIEEWPAEK